MCKKLFFFLILPFLATSQVQIGQDIDGEAAGDWSGHRVSLSEDGSILAIGASAHNGGTGRVRIYENLSGVWTQIGDDIDGEKLGAWFGYSVSLSSDGSVIAAVTPGQNYQNAHVRVYENISGVWTQIGNDIDSQAVGSLSGGTSNTSVSLSSDGSVIAVGTPYINNRVRVYENLSGVWTQIGNDIDGEAAGDRSGWSVSLSADGSIVAIGAIENNNATGHVRVYENLSGVWTQIGSDIDGEAAGDRSGYNVSLSSDGTVVAISSQENSGNGSYSGHVRIYKNLSGNWTQIGDDIDGENAGDRSGFSVSLSSDGTIIAIGALLNSGNGINDESGHVRIFQNISGVWTQIGTYINGEAPGDWFGYSVSLSSDGKTVAIGAPLNGGNGHVRVYDISGILSTNNFVSESFDVFPNPVSDVLNIRMKNNWSLEKVTIYNNLGQIVKTAQQNTVDVSALSKGIYFVEVTTNQGKAVKKVIVR